jgi:hypothetical protein
MLKETRKLILIFVEVLTGTMKFAYEESIMAKGEIKKKPKKNQNYSKHFSDEYLWFFRKLSLQLFQNKLVQFLSITTLICLTFLTLFQTYLFLQKFDGYYFIQYLAVYAGSYYVRGIVFHKVK